MKRLIFLLSIGVAFAGCGKEITYSNEYSAATFINAAPGNTALNVLVDNANQTSTSLVFKATSGYLNIAPGSHNILAQSTNVLTPVNFVSLAGQSFTANQASTYVVYDTLATPSGTLKVIRLSDTLTAPAAGFIKFRLLTLAPLAPAVDVTYLRTSSTPNDSVTVTGLSYPGASPSQALIDKLSTFSLLPAGSYTIKQKLAGTQTVYSSATYTPSVGGINKGIYTFYTSGTAQSQAFGISVIRNYP